MRLRLFLFSLILIIIFARLTLVILPSYKIDMNTWQAWTIRLVQVTPINFYSPGYFADYFPGYLYMLYFLGNSFHFIFPNLSIVSLGFEYYLKLFTNIFDILTAIFIFKIISRYNQKWGLIAIILYLANPALLFNSSIMGQVDGIVTFFLVCSTYYLIELKKPIKWSITSSLAFLVKPQGLVILPVSLIYLFRNFQMRKFFSILVIPSLMTLISIFFFPKDPILGLLHLLQKSANVYPYSSIFSYNFWSFTGFWKPDSINFLGITYQVWGLIIFCINLLIIILPLLKKSSGHQNKAYYLAIALSFMNFFMFLTRIHQRYLFPFFAFLLIFISLKNSIKFMLIYLLLSIIHFINLWYVYYYYNYVYQNPEFSSLLIYKFLSANYNLFTIINLLSFIILMFIYYRLFYK